MNACLDNLDKPKISFFVPGVARPAGSKNAFMHPATKRIIVTDSGGQNTRDWKTSVRQVAVEYFDKPLEGPIKLEITFQMIRPKCHWRSGQYKHLFSKYARKYPTVKPDATKLLRCLEDALTKIAWIDDTQVVIQNVYKVYAETSGAQVTIQEIE